MNLSVLTPQSSNPPPGNSTWNIVYVARPGGAGFTADYLMRPVVAYCVERTVATVLLERYEQGGYLSIPIPMLIVSSYLNYKLLYRGSQN